jgi:hypothetical protein
MFLRGHRPQPPRKDVCGALPRAPLKELFEKFLENPQKLSNKLLIKQRGYVDLRCNCLQ